MAPVFYSSPLHLHRQGGFISQAEAMLKAKLADYLASCLPVPVAILVGVTVQREDYCNLTHLHATIFYQLPLFLSPSLPLTQPLTRLVSSCFCFLNHSHCLPYCSSGLTFNGSHRLRAVRQIDRQIDTPSALNATGECRVWFKQCQQKRMLERNILSHTIDVQVEQKCCQARLTLRDGLMPTCCG